MRSADAASDAPRDAPHDDFREVENFRSNQTDRPSCSSSTYHPYLSPVLRLRSYVAQRIRPSSSSSSVRADERTLVESMRTEDRRRSMRSWNVSFGWYVSWKEVVGLAVNPVNSPREGLPRRPDRPKLSSSSTARVSLELASASTKVRFDDGTHFRNLRTHQFSPCTWPRSNSSTLAESSPPPQDDEIGPYRPFESKISTLASASMSSLTRERTSFLSRSRSRSGGYRSSPSRLWPALELLRENCEKQAMSCSSASRSSNSICSWRFAASDAPDARPLCSDTSRERASRFRSGESGFVDWCSLNEARDAGRFEWRLEADQPRSVEGRRITSSRCKVVSSIRATDAPGTHALLPAAGAVREPAPVEVGAETDDGGLELAALALGACRARVRRAGRIGRAVGRVALVAATLPRLGREEGEPRRGRRVRSSAQARGHRKQRVGAEERRRFGAPIAHANRLCDDDSTFAVTPAPPAARILGSTSRPHCRQFPSRHREIRRPNFLARYRLESDLSWSCSILQLQLHSNPHCTMHVAAHGPLSFFVARASIKSLTTS